MNKKFCKKNVEKLQLLILAKKKNLFGQNFLCVNFQCKIHGGRGQRKPGTFREKNVVRESEKCQGISKLVREK